MDFLSHPRRTRNPGYIHGMNANLAETLEAYARGIIRGIHPIDSGQSEAVLRAMNNWGWDDDLKLYMPFDETSGQTAFDLSGNGNTGTATGTTIVDGVFGKARSFNGTSDYVQVLDAVSLDITSALTLVAWVKPTLGSSNYIMSRYDRVVTSKSFLFFLGSTGRLNCAVSDNGSNDQVITSTSVAAGGAWSQVVAVYDGTTLKLFINRVEVASLNYALGIFAGTEDLWIGTRRTVDPYFSGLIDEPRMYSRALSADEIYLHYLAGALKLGLI